MDTNLNVIQYVYKNANMGADSISNLIRAIENKDNKIKDLLEDMLKEYESFADKAKDLLKMHNLDPKDLNAMTKTSAYMMIKMEMLRDNSDSHVADMLLKGSTMGIVEIEKQIKAYEGKCDKKVINLAKELLEHEKKNVEKVKEYL